MKRLLVTTTLLALVAAACGDTGAPHYSRNPESLPEPGDDGPPPAPDNPESLPGPEGWSTVDLHGDSAIKLNRGECWIEHDCATGQSCMHSEFFLDRAGTPGVCLLHPSAELVRLSTVSPVRFTDGGSSPDPATDDFVVEPGVFDITFMADQDGWTQAFYPTDWALPSPAPGFGFRWQLGIYIRVVDPDDPDYDIECKVAFLRSGDVVGGMVREPGKVLCSTNNWQSPQDPGDPGLLIEYE